MVAVPVPLNEVSGEPLAFKRVIAKTPPGSEGDAEPTTATSLPSGSIAHPRTINAGDQFDSPGPERAIEGRHWGELGLATSVSSSSASPGTCIASARMSMAPSVWTTISEAWVTL